MVLAPDSRLRGRTIRTAIERRAVAHVVMLAEAGIQPPPAHPATPRPPWRSGQYRFLKQDPSGR